MENSNADRAAVLKAYETLRVADVRDGMDTVGLPHVGSMWPSIRPVWRTRAFGIARTCRYVPYDGPMIDRRGEAYWEWSYYYYKEICPYPWMDDVQPGDFVVIDASGVNSGLMGSMNTLEAMRLGARGYVSSGGVRDTDEIILQKVPFWSAMISQSMVQCRLKYEDKNVPVTVGGVRVCPGDLVMGDGDGVIVVPSEVALEVARWADAEHRRDMVNRRGLYEALGMKPDDTLASQGMRP
jgi:4-hydroxy-4-methyl-2-oxoglutarate aldolase